MSRESIEKNGQKIDVGKPKIDLVTPESIIGMAEVLTEANKKYTENSWQNIENGKSIHYSAAMRHLLLWKSGEKIDKETGLNHIKHAMTNLMFLLYHDTNEKKDEEK